MRAYISADIEGVAGITNSPQLTPAGWEFQSARKWMTGEVIAAAEALHEAGVSEVVVADGHGTGQNILIDDVPDYMRVVRSWPRPLLQMQGVEDGPYEAVVFIGHHTSSLSPDGLLSHTYHGGCYRDIRINGESNSETGFNAMLAAHYGIKTIFSSGDESYIEHVKSLNSDIETFVTKKTYGLAAINTLKPAVAQKQIKEGVARAFARRDEISLLVLPAEFRVELEFKNRIQADMWNYLPWVERTGPASIGATLKDMEQVMKLISFGMFYQPKDRPQLA